MAKKKNVIEIGFIIKIQESWYISTVKKKLEFHIRLL